MYKVWLKSVKWFGCSKGTYGRTDERTDERTDVTFFEVGSYYMPYNTLPRYARFARCAG